VLKSIFSGKSVIIIKIVLSTLLRFMVAYHNIFKLGNVKIIKIELTISRKASLTLNPLFGTFLPLIFLLNNGIII
jgi:hypothetical protein